MLLVVEHMRLHAEVSVCDAMRCVQHNTAQRSTLCHALCHTHTHTITTTTTTLSCLQVRGADRLSPTAQRVLAVSLDALSPVFVCWYSELSPNPTAPDVPSPPLGTPELATLLECLLALDQEPELATACAGNLLWAIQWEAAQRVAGQLPPHAIASSPHPGLYTSQQLGFLLDVFQHLELPPPPPPRAASPALEQVRRLLVSACRRGQRVSALQLTL
jgi:hypothetical protein